MKTILAEKLKLKYFPVAILFSDQKPENALQFQEGKRGCVTALLTAAMKGKTVVIDRKTVGCIGGMAGMCYGNQYHLMPGGIEYFLSTGRGEGYREGEGYIKDPKLAKQFVDTLPYVDIGQQYVVIKPLQEVDCEVEEPQLVCMYANPDQLSALVVLANYDREMNDHVIIPFASGCQSICLLPYAQKKAALPKAVIGMTDITVRPLVPAEVLSFTIPFTMYQEMEKNCEGCFLDKEIWQKVVKRF